MSRSPKGLFKPAGWRAGSQASEPPSPPTTPTSPPTIEATPPIDQPPAVTIIPPSSEVAVADGRALAGLEAQEARERLRERTREVLQHASVPLDETNFDLLISNIRRANSKYEAAFEALLDTGRTLLAIQKTVGPGGYKALVEAKIVQIGETNASKLRQIALAVESGKIPEPLLPAMPRNLSGAYVIATLPGNVIEPTMRALLDRGMLPECNYRKLEQEIKILRENTGRAPDLHIMLQRKRKAVERLQQEIVEIENKIRSRRPAPAESNT